MEWPVVNIDEWRNAGVETQGRHEHFWFSPGPRDRRTSLFKPARSDRERSAGEDVAEKLGSELAMMLGIPCAPVELAMRGGERGALVEDVRPSGWELHLGQTLMTEVVANYDPDDSEQRGHNVVEIQKALSRFAAPPGAETPIEFGAFEVFTGYLVFDALVAHGDRHDRNWAVLRPPPGSTESEALCASFDHAAVLGLLLPEGAQAKRVADCTVDAFAQRGRASRFEHRSGSPWASLVDLAASASDLCTPSVGGYWHARLLSVDADSVERVVNAAPGLSDATRRFVRELVRANRERLLRVIG